MGVGVLATVRFLSGPGGSVGLLRSVGGRSPTRLLDRPGIVGGGIDGWMMKKIADHAMKEFPAVIDG